MLKQLIISIFFCYSAVAQTVTVAIKDSTNFDGLQLFSYYPNKFAAGIERLEAGKAIFKMNNQQSGFYSIYLLNTKTGVQGAFIDILWDSKEQNFSLEWTVKENAVNFSNSPLNTQLRLFNERNEVLKRQLGAMERFVADCNCGHEPAFKTIKGAIIQKELEIKANINSYKKAHSNEIAAIIYNIPPMESATVANYWALVPLGDKRIFNSPFMGYAINVLATKISMENKQWSSLQVSKAVIDNMVQHFAPYPAGLQYLNDYAHTYFENQDKEELFIYTYEKLVQLENCDIQGGAKDDLQSKLAKFRKLKIGQPFPLLIDSVMHFNNMATNNLIVALYTTVCSHCKEEIPILNDSAAKVGIPVLGICLDGDKTHDNKVFGEWNAAHKNIQHYYNSTYSAAFIETYIQYGTPTFYLLQRINGQWIITAKDYKAAGLAAMEKRIN